MRFINLTPHEVVVAGVKFPASGQVARVDQVLSHTDDIDVHEYGVTVPLAFSELGQVIGLPPREPGTLLIVSQMVVAASPERFDLFFPAGLVRDTDGRVIGSQTLARPKYKRPR